jgi:hypothetical protein
MILRGLFFLARGAKEGMKEFGDDMDSFTSSLAPLIAIPLVAAGLVGGGGDWRGAVMGFLAQLCWVLALPVIMFEYARWLQRDTQWLRTAVALNWSVWLVLPVALLAGILGALVAAFGVPVEVATLGALGALLAYMFWLRWFIFTAGLGLTGWQAAGLVMICAAVQVVCLGTPLVLGFTGHGMLSV